MRRSIIAAVVAGAMCLATDAFAHHSFAAEFDAAKPVSLTGTLTKLEWTNPHARVHIDVANESWDCELGTPNDLLRGGWSKDTVKLGDTITINGYAAKNGSRTASARQVIFNGRTIFTRSTKL